MKIKTDFITNSSSSSFLITNAKDGYSFPNYGKELIAGSDIGETEFGWGPELIHDVGSRINFAYLQTTYVNHPEWLKMLEDVIKKILMLKKLSGILLLNMILRMVKIGVMLTINLLHLMVVIQKSLTPKKY